MTPGLAKLGPDPFRGELQFVFSPALSSDGGGENFVAAKSRFVQELREFAAGHGWSVVSTNEIDLILEEWLTNVASYAFAGVPHPHLALEIRAEGDDALLRIEDNGIHFDPTARPDPDTTAPAEERPIGGLGIFMMKKLCRRLAYERIGDLNVLRMWKTVREPAALAEPLKPNKQ